MAERNQAVRTRILLAAVTCIERDGLEATGIREIAREAGVNSAAINYYFQSKDNLIALALEGTLEEAFGAFLSDFDKQRASGLEVKAALEKVLEDYLMHSTRFPRIAHAHLRDALVKQSYDAMAVKRLNAFLAELTPRIAPAVPHLSETALRIALSQIWAALMLLGMLPGLFQAFVPLNFDREEDRRAWGRQILKVLFG
ncbi:TetR/AcrR family transcriptional regulator [Hyalangium rubrum]|uniref:Helix-turn-helix domain-containing protein n=1 Tax=Hyalangium rubrum TaxID=3103134 RepID=A0ABU5GVV8_9BACT|nr:helix-turn-helix domain-containing protein [Hyalangium sp. s54d21]MDY7225321.1 helix-turn-helix domain-containing protein [Hyalangium sp. s54d21]